MTLAAMVLSGQVMGVLFDTYRVAAHELRFRRWMLPVLDLAYWVFAVIFVFRMLYITNYGELRLFVFLGLLLGVSIYFTFVSSLTVLAVKQVFVFIRRMFSLFLKLVQFVIIKPITLLVRLFVTLGGVLGAIAIFLYKIVIQLLYPVWMVVRSITRPLHRHVRFFRVLGHKLIQVLQWIKDLFRKFR